MTSLPANPFDDPAHVALYAERAAQMVPAMPDIHRMVGVLVDERVPPEARVLVLGAGGGLETKALATAHPRWAFDAVDPSAPMLDLAVRTLGSDASRVRTHHGYVDDAPPGPFDAATSLLTLHFLARDERVRTVAEVRRRLAPGAPFVVVHVSMPGNDETERGTWMDRHIAYLGATVADVGDLEKARVALSQTPFLTPEQDRAVIEEAGFVGVMQFFSSFSLRGWVGYA